MRGAAAAAPNRTAAAWPAGCGRGERRECTRQEAERQRKGASGGGAGREPSLQSVDEGPRGRGRVLAGRWMPSSAGLTISAARFLLASSACPPSRSLQQFALVPRAASRTAKASQRSPSVPSGAHMSRTNDCRARGSGQRRGLAALCRRACWRLGMHGKANKACRRHATARLPCSQSECRPAAAAAGGPHTAPHDTAPHRTAPHLDDGWVVRHDAQPDGLQQRLPRLHRPLVLVHHAVLPPQLQAVLELHLLSRAGVGAGGGWGICIVMGDMYVRAGAAAAVPEPPG